MYIEDTTGLGNFENTNINSHSNQSSFELFPNPANDFIVVSAGLSPPYNITLSNVLGEIVLRQNIQSNLEIIETRTLNTGVYFYTISSNKHNQSGKLIIK
jgi:hypothetical protein